MSTVFVRALGSRLTSVGPSICRGASSARIFSSNLPRNDRRFLASPAPSSSSSSDAPQNYPFSAAALCSSSPIPYQPELGLMGNVERRLIASCANQEFYVLFKKNHPEAVRPLSILRVETYTNSTRTTTSVFTGILMAVRRRGTETSFRLRAIVERIGVEQKFNVFSPVIKNITVIKRAGDMEGATHGKALIKKPRRAKLYYLRDHPRKMPDVRKVMKAVVAAKERPTSD